jgi:PAS domain S-box-containing protein
LFGPLPLTTEPIDLLAALRQIKLELRGEHEEPSMERVQTLFEGIVAELPLMVVRADTGVIVHATKVLESHFGYLPGGLLNKSVHDLVPSEKREAHRGHFARYAANPEARQMGDRSMDLQGLKKDGTTFPVVIGLFPREHDSAVFVVALVMPMRHAAANPHVTAASTAAKEH